MIDIIKNTPAAYSSGSRDYQVLARLYTAALNISKSYTDSMQVWSTNSNKKLSMLKAHTLNFRPKHQWDDKSLATIISCFKYLSARKGAMKAAEECVNILSRVNNISGESSVEFDDNTLTFKLPEELVSVGAMADLLDYIVPAGINYNVILYKVVNNDATINAIIRDSAYFDSEGEIPISDMRIYASSEGSEGSHEGNTIMHNIVKMEDEDEI